VNINATLVGQVITFAIFIAFCMKYVWPPLLNAMQDRENKIADGLDAANRAERDLRLAQEQVNDQLRESKQQAAEIIDQANRRANQLIDEAKEEASQEGQRLVIAAQSEIEQDVNRAKEALRKQVSALVFEGASKILSTEIDEKAHDLMITQLSNEL
jgi:F-type H+-transporting ATPase subunit b